MTYQRQAMTLVGLALAAAGLGGCGGKPQQPATTVQGSIVYAASSGDTSAEIDVVDADVTTKLEKDGLPVGADPAWSPHGEYVAYVTDKHQVAVVRKDGTLGVLVGDESPDPSALPSRPEWLADGTLSYAVGGRLEVVQPTGAKVREVALTTPDGKPLTGVGAYAWSPDGTLLVYACGAGQQTLLCRMTLKSHQVRTLLDPKLAFGALDFSPDGSMLVAGNGSGPAQPVEDVYTFTAAGKDLRALAQPGRESDPAWSPDGSKIIFASARDKDSGLWVMSATGGDAAVVLREADARHPDWG